MELLAQHDVVLIRAGNPGPFTLTGTNTWVVGRDPAWVIDPGPALDAHVEEVADEVERRGGLGGIALTHDHPDHADGDPGAARAARRGAAARGCARHRRTAAARRRSRRPARGARDARPRARPPLLRARRDDRLHRRRGARHRQRLHRARPATRSRLPRRARTAARPRPRADLPRPRPARRGPGREDRRVPRAPARARAALLDALDARRCAAPTSCSTAAWPDAPEVLRPAAAVTLAAHLDKLADEGKLPWGVERPAWPVSPRG